METLNYKIWNQEHDENLCSLSKYLKISHNVNNYYENGDIYNGTLSKGKKNGFGIYREYLNGFIDVDERPKSSANGSRLEMSLSPRGKPRFCFAWSCRFPRHEST